MKLIDSKGRVLGRMNIFDLFVLCILAAMAALAFKWMMMAEDPSWVNVRTAHTKCLAVLSLPNQPSSGPGLPAYVADLVRDGDEAFDADGQRVAVIEQVMSNEPSEKVVYVSGDGEKVFFDNDDRKVVVRLDLVSYEKKGSAYSSASGLPIRVGNNIPLTTKNYTVMASIRKLSE